MSKIPPVRFYSAQRYNSQYHKNPYLLYPDNRQGSEQTPEQTTEQGSEQRSVFRDTLTKTIKRFVDSREPDVKKTVFKSKDGEIICADIVHTTSLSRVIMYRDETLGRSICSIADAPLKGDFYPDYYKGEKYLFVNSPLYSSKKYKGIGTELMKEIVRMSKKMGMESRVCLTASTINPNMGSPIPFYYKIGFRSTNSEFNKNIAQHIADGGKTPLTHSSTSMFLPRENIETLLSKNYLQD